MENDRENYQSSNINSDKNDKVNRQEQHLSIKFKRTGSNDDDSN